MTTRCPATFHHQTLTKSISMVAINHRDVDGEFKSLFFIWWILFCSSSLHLLLVVLNLDVFLNAIELSFLFPVPPAIPLLHPLVTGFPQSKRRISFSLSISPLLPKNRHLFSIGSSSDEEEGGGSKYNESNSLSWLLSCVSSISVVSCNAAQPKKQVLIKSCRLFS